MSDAKPIPVEVLRTLAEAWEGSDVPFTDGHGNASAPIAHVFAYALALRECLEEMEPGFGSESYYSVRDAERIWDRARRLLGEDDHDRT